MRHITRALWFAAVALSMAGCGSQIAPTGSSTTASNPSSTTASQPSVFPVTVSRTGGVAGFQDVVVVAEDGLVSVTRKGKAQAQCRLSPDAVGALTAKASAVAWPRITPTSTAPAFPDDMVMTVRSAAGGPVRLEDDQIGAGGKIFQKLFDDIITGGSSGICLPI
jgi:hypothetical protein